MPQYSYYYATRFTFILFIFLSCYKIHGGNLGSMDVRILLHLLLPLLLHRHRTDHLLLFVFVLLLLLLSDNIKEQHGVFKRVARLCRLWGQWLLHDNLNALHAHICIVGGPLHLMACLLPSSPRAKSFPRVNPIFASRREPQEVDDTCISGDFFKGSKEFGAQCRKGKCLVRSSLNHNLLERQSKKRLGADAHLR